MMKRKLLLKLALYVVIFWATLIASVFAQIANTIRVKAGEDLGKAISDYGIYRFPAFITGDFALHNGKSSSAKLNYNYLLEEMQFINAKGDTLSITNKKDINYFKINSKLFYFRDGYMEIIADFDSLQLAIRQSIKIGFEKNGAYDLVSPAAAIDNLTVVSFYDSRFMYDRTFRYAINRDAVVEKQTFYYFIYKHYSVQQASKANLLKIFPGAKTAINNYIKHNRIKFRNKEEIIQTILFCANNSSVK